MIPFVHDFLRGNGLQYKELLFNLRNYKEHFSKRKVYFEKLCEKDSFWKKYKTVYLFEHAKHTDVITLSNIEKDGWDLRRNITGRDEIVEVRDKLQEQLEVMPKTSCYYEMAFHQINWFCDRTESKSVRDSWCSSLYPLSSNITIWKDYLGKRYIVLNFEMETGDIDLCNKYVEGFAAKTGCSYKKEIDFVLSEEEKKLYAKNKEYVRNLIVGYERSISIEDSSAEKSNLHIKNVLKRVFTGTKFQLGDIENGVYEIYKIDSYNNKFQILFDYDRENRSGGAVFYYIGMGFRHFVDLPEIEVYLTDESIECYMRKVYDKTVQFEVEYVPLIMEKYPDTPKWFIWD